MIIVTHFFYYAIALTQHNMSAKNEFLRVPRN